MTTALVVEGTPAGSEDLAGDLSAAGIHVLGAASRSNLVRDAVRLGPDVVVCQEVSADEPFFVACALLDQTAPRPVVVFTLDPEAAKIERAMRSGIHAYVVNGYAAHRLRHVIHVAEARFQNDRRMRDALADVSRRFDERKLVDRAKGILMRARQFSEDEAFAVLRAASMHSNRRVGQVSQQVIAAAHYADAVNRAGKLRMLSQRLVKAAALCMIEPHVAGHALQRSETHAQIDADIAALAKSLSLPTFGDLLASVRVAWAGMQASALATPTVAALIALDAGAEQLLAAAEQLTRQIDTAGLVNTLHIVNVSGRQRMLSQRHAKLALLGLLRGGGAADQTRVALLQTAATFEQAMAHLHAAPLSTRDIRDLLADADGIWSHVAQAARHLHHASGAGPLESASETLLQRCEQLTERYERSVQVLMG